MSNKRSILRSILLIFVGGIVVAVTCFELAHKHRFGHFVPYGLHVDVLNEDVSIGIPGQKKLYKAELANFSLWPVSLQACDYLTDAFERGTEYPYAVQRWDIGSGRWQTIAEPNAENFCRPVPLSKVKTHLVLRRLWPSAHVQIMEGEATGAREAFEKDDRARFVVFRSLDTQLDWRNGIASEPFSIEDDVARDDVPFRVKH